MTIKERLDELKEQIAKLDIDRENIAKAWADDVKKTTSEPKFDIYSKKADTPSSRLKIFFQFLP